MKTIEYAVSRLRRERTGSSATAVVGRTARPLSLDPAPSCPCPAPTPIGPPITV